MKVFFISRNGNAEEALISPDFTSPQEIRITHEGVEVIGDQLKLDHGQTEIAEAYLGKELGPAYDIRLDRLCRLIKIGIRYGKTGKLTEQLFLEIATKGILKRPVGNRDLTNQFLSLGFREGTRIRRHFMAISQ